MGKTYGWSLAGVVLLGGMAGAQGTQPNNTQIKPAQTQPGQAQPGQLQPGQRQVQPGQVQPGRVQPGQVQPGQARVVPGQGGGQRQLNQRNGEQEVAALIAACNRNEVEVAKFAMDKLQSDEAKELATMLVKEHTAAAEKFEQLAGQTGQIHADDRDQRGEGRREERREEGREERRDDDRRDNDRRDNERSDATRDEANRQNVQTNAATAPNSPTARVAVQGNAVQPNVQPGNTAQPRIALKPAMAGHLDWSTIHQEIADESLRGCKEELSRYEGKEFDKAFLGHQLGAHLKTATELKVLRRHVSGQLAAEIDNAHATTEKHIKHLRDLMDEKKDEK